MGTNNALLFTVTVAISWIAVTMAAGNHSLHIERKDSSPSHVLITWTLPEEYNLTNFHVEAYKKGSDSKIIGPLETDSSLTEYRVPDLMTNSKYEICMFTELEPANLTLGLPDIEVDDCAWMSTPPAIRWDSILVLACVIGYILLMVLLGYLFWRCAMRKHEQGEPESCGEDGPEAYAIEEKIENGERRPFLLNSPPPAMEPRPGTKLEDEDIPFITPTWEQIARENNKA